MTESHCLVHISDTHFGTEKARVVDALAERINEIKPDIVLCSGDLTQRARASQFRSALRFFNSLNCDRLVCVPGNHDMPLYNIVMRVLSPFYNYTRHIGQMLQTELILQSAVIIGLNTCNPWHYKNGRISHDQIRAVQHTLKSHSNDKMKILVCHHPFDVIHDYDQENILEQAQIALQNWGDAGLDLIMAGHIHHQFCRNLQHRYSDLPKPIYSCQAGTATSCRTRFGLNNSFMQLTIRGIKFDSKILQWDFIEGQDAFMVTEEFSPWIDSQSKDNHKPPIYGATDRTSLYQNRF